MLREKIIKANARFNMYFNANKIMKNMLNAENLENTEENIFKMYKKVFANSKHNGNIQLKKIGKVYENGFKAVHDFNLNIKEHEFVSLLGPSGCGKTTILRMIAGLELISEGQLEMGGVTMNSSLPRERGLAMVFQNYALYPYMTVYDNVAFGLKNKTYANNISAELMIKALDALNPAYSKIRLLKAKIYHENHLHKSLLNELKLRIKKEKKVGTDDKLLEQLVTRYKALLIEQKNHRSGKGKANILKFREEIRAEIANQKNTNKKIDKNENYKKAVKNYVNSIILWKKSIPSRINYFSKMVGISDYLRRKPHALSGGQRQRVALVRAISKDASLFLFDEPLSNLDAKLRGTMRSEIRRLHESLNSSSVFVTHDQVEAMTMSDRIVLLNKGYIQQIGTPSELFNSPANIFVADFIGSPGINFIEGTLTNNYTVKLGNKNMTFSKKNSEINKVLSEHKGKKVVLGIRPQNIISDVNLVSHAKANIFEAEVVSVESIGHENIVTIKSKELGNAFKIVGGRYFTPKTKEVIKISIDPNSIQIFDLENGFSISTIQNEETLAAREVWIKSSDERIKNQILSEYEKNKERLSKRIAKDAIGIVNTKYGAKRKANKARLKNLSKTTKDQSLLDQVSGQGGN